MAKQLSPELKNLQIQIEESAKKFGLDFFDCIYEVLDYEEMNMVAAYGGFPTRYPHWKWGMEYDRLKKSYEYGLSKIYEMVINNDPCYAYLLESNPFVDQKLVMCHVTGHNDFFKNNFVFSHTNRKMLNEMGNHATRIRGYMDLFCRNEVEAFIDSALSVENLIDFNTPYKNDIESKKNYKDEVFSVDKNIARLPNDKEYMERYLNPEYYINNQKLKLQEEQEKKDKQFPIKPTRDILGFLIDHAPLKRWQADILDIIRKEAYYFAPQAMTKIMNEGWASYWHSKLMTQVVMTPGEIIDFADRHSGVTASSPNSLNPYKLGIELFRDIEERWNNGQFGLEYERCDDIEKKSNWNTKTNLGAEKILQVRKIYCDLTFIDEFLTLDFCKANKLFSFAYDKRKQEYAIESRDFLTIKQKLLNSLTNFGRPVIQIINANHENRSELLLEHTHYGIDLDFRYAKETLRNLSIIWGRMVHLLTKVEGKVVLLSHDKHNYNEQIIGNSL